ncbi:RNA polymerase sigma-70 factor [Chitinophaga agrisoli]|uniref:RNA polymerase sigma-70 factor n=1 Tax=Chitinophaga agrisoli TaxID=2607653 RepID=A0A5B2VRN9_9BACT|nr:RNA polymerase sigma-70 factor [Chitinophaga agrisoli]KAA2241280.1 RNA polymerase sigma-70 factor [Chitinophaga agrisoli]
MNETVLIDGLKKGEEAVLRQLFEQLYPRLCHFARGILQNDIEAEDLVQEAFMKLWRQRQQFSSYAAVRSFLYTSIRNAALNILKHQRVVREHAGAENASEAEEINAEHHLIAAEVSGQLQQALAKLPPGCKQVMELGYLQGLRNNEIANLLQVSVNTIKTQKARGLYLLKGWLKLSRILLFLLK